MSDLFRFSFKVGYTAPVGATIMIEGKPHKVLSCSPEEDGLWLLDVESEWNIFDKLETDLLKGISVDLEKGNENGND